MVAGLDRQAIAGDRDGMRITDRNFWVALLAAIAVLSSACTGQVAPREIPTPRGPEPTPAPVTLNLPWDDGPHDAPIEWWYYNGHLMSDDGDEYSFHFVIFQTQDEEGAESFEIGQAGITDVGNGVHHHLASRGFASDEDGSGDPDAKLVLVNLDLGNFSLEIDLNGRHFVEALDEDTGLKLSTVQPEAVMLHEGIGWMEWPSGSTYYYSYPRVETEGTLMIEGREVGVEGEIWFDHQWGDFFVVGKPAGWQWFALHLDDGCSLMVSEVRDGEGEVIAVDGTLVDADGRHQVLESERDGLELDVLDRWESPETGGDYPAKWRLRVASLGMDLTLVPTISNQEIPAFPYGNQAAAYWEGRADVFDSESGETKGVAFVELSGYVDPDPLIWRDEAR